MGEQRVLKDWISAYLEYTNDDEPRNTFRTFTALGGIAACLQRKCHINWENKIYPNLYTVLVGPPAARKNTSIAPMELMLRDLSMPTSAQATTREALIRRLRMYGELPKEDDRQTLVVSTDASMNIISNEFTVFLGTRNSDMIALLCDWYDCHSDWTYETKNQGTDKIQNVWVNLLAGTTPTALKESLPRESVGMGLTSRIIFVFEEDKGKAVYFPPNVDVYYEDSGAVGKLNPDAHAKWSHLRDRLMHDLEIIGQMDGTFIPTDKFHIAYHEFRKSFEENPPFRGTMLEGYANRKLTHLRKLAMLFSASRSSEMLLRPEDFQRAIDALSVIERKMNLTFSGIGKSDLADTTQAVMAMIARDKVVTFSKLQKEFWTDADKITLLKILDTCKAARFCEEIFKGTEPAYRYLEENSIKSEEIIDEDRN